MLRVGEYAVKDVRLITMVQSFTLLFISVIFNYLRHSFNNLITISPPGIQTKLAAGVIFSSQN